MRRLVSFALLLALLGAAFAAGRRFATRQTVFAASPDGSKAAWASERRCWSGPCETLWIADANGSATRVATLPGTGRCHEIAWIRDGSRVAFLIDGTQLHFYDPSARAPAGRLTLLASEAAPSRSVVRGVTFSENGRAITYDECPRGRSGCRAGLAAVPR